MNRKDQELMERYIYQVVRRLPKNQRSEVAMELQELIGDMAEETGDMKKVLIQLGSPAEFAKRYQEHGNYLIGPEYYDNYVWFLKVVLLCMIIPILVTTILTGIRAGIGLTEQDVIQVVVTSVIAALTRGLSDLITAAVGVFGGITLMFAVMERKKVKFELKKEKEWTVNDLGDNFTGKRSWSPNYLSPIPHKKAIIQRSDSIVGIVFIVIFSVLLIFAPQVFGVIRESEGVTRIIPVFNLEKWNYVLPVFVLSMFAGLADEIFRLVIGYYCKAVMISNIICGTIQIILSVVILKVFPFWNPDFVRESQLKFKDQAEGIAGFVLRWNMDTASNVLLAFCVIVTLLEIGTTIYKTLRYGMEGKSTEA